MRQVNTCLGRDSHSHPFALSHLQGFRLRERLEDLPVVLQLAGGRTRLTPALPDSEARAHPAILSALLWLPMLSSHCLQEDKVAG